MPTFIYPTTVPVSTAPTFEVLLAKMMPHFRYYAKRHLRRKGSRRFDYDDVMQELIGFALGMYRSLIRRGRAKEVYFTPIMQFAIKRHRAGRRFIGTKTSDVLSEPIRQSVFCAMLLYLRVRLEHRRCQCGWVPQNFCQR